MVGMAAAVGGYSITPAFSGRVLIVANSVASNSTAASGVDTWVQIGTGTAPAAGVAQTGSQLTGTYSVISTSANQGFPITIPAMSVSLTVGVAYWIDLAYRTTSGGTGKLTGGNVIAVEF